jgi:hypothetical protein
MPRRVTSHRNSRMVSHLDGGSMQANLEWIEREWRNWLKSERGEKCVGTGRVKEHPEHIAKLFAAFCLERLRMEAEAAEQVG